jgi:hypothetical protein
MILTPLNLPKGEKKEYFIFYFHSSLPFGEGWGGVFAKKNRGFLRSAV